MLPEEVYVFGDGDRTRMRIDALLFDARLDQLALVSRQISEAIVALSNHVASRISGSRVIIAGGDDILFVLPHSSYQASQIHELAAMYAEATGGTISFGVATSVERAYLALRKAKALGTGIVVDSASLVVAEP